MSDAPVTSKKVATENNMINHLNDASTWAQWMQNYSNLRVYQDNNGLNANPNAAKWNTKTGEEETPQRHVTFTNPYGK